MNLYLILYIVLILYGIYTYKKNKEPFFKWYAFLIGGLAVLNVWHWFVSTYLNFSLQEQQVEFLIRSVLKVSIIIVMVGLGLMRILSKDK